MKYILLTFIVSFFLLLSMIFIFSYEQKRGHRIIFVQFRQKFDNLLLLVEVSLQRLSYWYRQLVLRWSVRYVIHVLLRSVLLGMVWVYDSIVGVFEKNLKVTRHLRRERLDWQNNTKNR